MDAPTVAVVTFLLLGIVGAVIALGIDLANIRIAAGERIHTASIRIQAHVDHVLHHGGDD